MKTKKAPLYKDIEGELNVKTKKRKREKIETVETSLVDNKLSAKILALASKQIKNDDETDTESEASENPPENEFFDVPVNEDPEEQQFFSSDKAPESQTLGKLILNKIKEAESENKKKAIQEDDKVIELFQSIGVYLSKYRSGRIPKAFKIVPSLSNWEEMLVLTEPDNWTPGAMFQAVKIFASNLKPEQAQRFYNLVLLPAIREDIKQNKRLHFQYYQALKKAIFKPSAWVQGILIPLLTNSCTLREAVIVASVLSKISLPSLHVAGALVLLCQLHKNLEDWTPATTYMIRTLLDKKVNLTVGVVNIIIEHFEKFIFDSRTFPVIWHQTLLVFVQRYKRKKIYDYTFLVSFQSHHIQKILKILKVQNHHLISAEIRRELDLAKSMCWMHDNRTEIPNPTTVVSKLS